MAVYEYKGLDGRGKAIAGIIDAEGAKSARARLRKQGLFPTDIKQQAVSGGGKGKAEKSGGGLSREVDVAAFFQRVGIKDVSAMTTQLATLIGANIPMVEALAADCLETATRDAGEIQGCRAP